MCTHLYVSSCIQFYHISSCIYHHSQDTGQFYHQKCPSLMLLFSNKTHLSSAPLHSYSLTPVPNPWHHRSVLHFDSFVISESCINEIIHYVNFFWDWRFKQVFTCSKSLFTFFAMLWVHHSFFNHHLLKSTCTVSRLGLCKHVFVSLG